MSRTHVSAVFLITALLVSTSGCDNKDSGGNNAASTTGIAVPRLITQAALASTGSLRAQLFLDGGSTPIAENLDVSTTAATVNFTVEIAPGDHTLTIKYSYVDPVFSGPWDLASATKPITVETNVTTPLDYTAGDFTYQDSDSDGLTNLAELDASMRTDPGDATCVQNKSVMGGPNQAGCKLG